MRTIPELLATTADRYPSRVWLRVDDTSLTFAEVHAAVAGVAQRLVDSGVGRGDRVLLTARTTPPYLFCWLATCSIGAIAVPVNPQSAPAEFQGLVAQTSPALVVTDDDVVRATAGADVFADRAVVDIRALVTDATATALPSQAPAEDDVAVLIPTSGTTGRSKLVMQTHRAYVMAGEGFPYWMELTADDVLMTSLPLFHVNAPAYSVLGSLAGGAGLVLLERFSASTFLDSARRYGATEFNAVGAMLEILMRQPRRNDDADNPLRLCYTGPSPTKERQLEIEDRLGLRIVCGYAMSESPYGLIWPHGQRPFGTLGTPRQHPTLGHINDVRVVDESGSDADVGATGELLLRNPAVTPGYWEMPAETAAAIVDGWLHTGDLVIRNADGTYTFVARKKEVLRRRGENLSPAEVEQVLEQHPDVQEAAVVGVPSDLTEDDIKAFVVLRAGATADPPQLREYCSERLAPFKVPRFWQFIDALPRTPTARVAKHLLPEGHPADEWDAEPPAPTTAQGGP